MHAKWHTSENYAWFSLNPDKSEATSNKDLKMFQNLEDLQRKLVQNNQFIHKSA